MYDAVADLPLRVEGYELGARERDTSSGFTRTTTTVVLQGDDEAGRGEDVTYEREDHVPLWDLDVDLTGEYTLDSFSDRLDEVDLWPEPPSRETFRHYRRWAFESAALDLALRQAGESLGEALDREYDPVRFVVSTRLPEDDGPPTADRVEDWLDVDPEMEFKLDPTPAWDEALIETLAATDAVRVVDLKGLYEGTDVDVEPGADFYRRVVEGVPGALVEDPALTDETRPVLDGHEARVTWDYPITGVESVRELPFEPEWLNMKPSRCGTVESVLALIDYCEREGIDLYGGGQFELGVGRGQLHALASLCYPDAPNDVAPAAYNDPEPQSGLPSSPLAPPAESAGFGW
ncbi:hypothetical protein [Halomicrobium salinisoli]|uniref:hypothetical protein n=1 Tax=Halomicrobium salinisoli TaxID=2878391 RepID=UPI001CF070F3|nr:hypothetical protein [Halomicrobium salinisoli]